MKLNYWELYGQLKRLFLEGASNFDQQPLIPIINEHHLDEIENPRLQCLRMQLMNYTLFATWCSGKKHIAAVALLSSPNPQPDDEFAEQDANFHLHFSKAVRDNSEMDIRQNEIHHAAKKDNEYQELLKNIKYGFPYQKSKYVPDLIGARGINSVLMTA